MQVIIVDDENKSRTTLKNYLKRYCPEVEVVAEADSVNSGAMLIESTVADCVFLDIEMPDGTGFDLLERIRALGKVNVIFTTAHDQYALKAFRYSAVDYLLKPIDPELLIQAVYKVSNESKTADIHNRLEALISNQNALEKIVLPTSDGIQLVKVKDIIRCQSDGNYTTIHLIDNQRILVSRTLKEYSNLLQENGFHRVHQSHLININFVIRFVNRDGGYIVMEDGSNVEISRRKKEDFLARLFKN